MEEIKVCRQIEPGAFFNLDAVGPNNVQNRKLGGVEINMYVHGNNFASSCDQSQREEDLSHRRDQCHVDKLGTD